MFNCKLLILLIIGASLSSCAFLDHRDYSDEMEFSFDGPMFEPNRDFMIVAGDSGRDYRSDSEIRGRTPATAKNAEDYRHDASLQRELTYLESKLSPEEFDFHREIRDQIGNVSQQIYFLRLRSWEQKEYLKSRGIASDFIRTSNLVPHEPDRNSYQSRSFASANYPKIHDVVLGMRKDDVMQNWGRPDRMDVAGDPRLENERWAYRRDGTVKYIYFESGRVEGWNER